MDDVERLIRDARPQGTGRHAPLSERARADLARLVASSPEANADSTPTRRRARALTWTAIATASLAALAIAVVVIAGALTPAPAFAATPPLLRIEGESEPAPAKLNALADELRAGPTAPDPAEGRQRIDVETWGLVTNPDGGLPTHIAPEGHTITIDPDGSRTERVTVAPAYDANGSPVTGRGIPTPGTVLSTTSTGPGEYGFIFPARLPTAGADLKTLLAQMAGYDDNTPANDWISLVTTVLLEQQPSAAEEAAILEMLATLDLRFAGTTTDRLERHALVFETRPSAKHFIDQILISPTGHILAAETIYAGHDRTDIRSPAVVSYYAWERN